MASLSPTGTVVNTEQFIIDTRQALIAADWSGLWWGLLLVLAAWLVGTVDAYLVGRNLDRSSSN
jgi:hypothetical protein